MVDPLFKLTKYTISSTVEHMSIAHYSQEVQITTEKGCNVD